MLRLRAGVHEIDQLYARVLLRPHLFNNRCITDAATCAWFWRQLIRCCHLRILSNLLSFDASVSQVRYLADHLHDAVLCDMRPHYVIGVVIGAYGIETCRTHNRFRIFCQHHQFLSESILCQHIRCKVTLTCCWCLDFNHLTFLVFFTNV